MDRVIACSPGGERWLEFGTKFIVPLPEFVESDRVIRRSGAPAPGLTEHTLLTVP